MPEVRLIDANALLKKMGANFQQGSRDGCDHPMYPIVEETIMDAPTITPESMVRHGRWIKKHKHVGGFRRYTGFDDMGEQHTITVDERAEFDDLYCSKCWKQSADNFLNYCPNCGARMDLEDKPDG